MYKFIIINYDIIQKKRIPGQNSQYTSLVDHTFNGKI